jgi:hypothetical protein
MGEVYRVWGARLGNGAYLLAESEQEAIKVVAGVFKLDEASLKAAPDKTVGLPSSGIILESSGKTAEFVPAVRPHNTMNGSWPKAVFSNRSKRKTAIARFVSPFLEGDSR